MQRTNLPPSKFFLAKSPLDFTYNLCHSYEMMTDPFFIIIKKMVTDPFFYKENALATSALGFAKIDISV